jgi:dolichyl-phosphate-mannose--protein O-mannosyl transferase
MRVTRLRLEPRFAQPMAWWLLFAFTVSYVPFFAVTRVLFLYHYLTPLVFATAFVVVWLEGAGWIRPEAAGRQRASYVGVQVAAVLGFVAVSPLTYGVSAGEYGAWLTALIRSWR